MWHLLYKEPLCKCYKVYEDYIKFDTKRHKTEKAQKGSFPKESVENVDLHKPIMSKIMTTHEECVKYNFAALLSMVLISKINDI